MSGTSCPVNVYDTTKRSEFGRGGCVVYGWPSSGGMLVKEPADIVDLEFLGLDRFKASPRSQNVVEEDAFCERMRKLGAKWWESEGDYFNVLVGERERSPLEASELVFGWPTTGGVWVLRFEDRQKRPKDFGRLHMALNMDERCGIIEEYGGTFYPEPEDVEELVHSS